MLKFEVVFWVEDKWATITVEANYHRKIDGRYQFIDGATGSQTSNIALEVDASEVLYIKKKEHIPSEVEKNNQITKFYNRYPQALSV